MKDCQVRGHVPSPSWPVQAVVDGWIVADGEVGKDTRSLPGCLDGSPVLPSGSRTRRGTYWLNKDDPNSSLQRVTEKQGEDAHTDGTLHRLTTKAQKDIVKIFLATREEMEDKRIDEVFGRDFLDSNFWLYWRTMFAFEEWHSALEMKLYLHRFIHHIEGLPDLSALKFTKYNQYESLVLPLYRVAARPGSRTSSSTPKSPTSTSTSTTVTQAGHPHPLDA